MRISDWSSDVCSSDLVGILAGFVDVEGVVRVLHGGDAQAAAHQGWDELHDKRRLAAARPAGEADHFHPAAHWHLAAHWLPLSWPTMCRSEEHTSELQSLMRISYAVFCLKKKTISETQNT